MLTGESLPVDKASGDRVFGATINRTGAIRMRATRVGRDTALSRIVQLVERAQGSRAPVARLADAISGVFTPAVIGLAVATFALWFVLVPTGERLPMALLIAVSVLIITCPCSLGLATPTAIMVLRTDPFFHEAPVMWFDRISCCISYERLGSPANQFSTAEWPNRRKLLFLRPMHHKKRSVLSIMVGTGRGASLGVLIKGGEALEAAVRIDTVVLDKTGTLTTGEPQVTDVLVAQGASRDELLRLAAGAEQHSEHPIGRAVVRAARARGLPLGEVTGFDAPTGRGVRAAVEGRAVLFGNARLMSEHGVDVSAWSERAEALHAQGRTTMYVALDGSLAGLIAVADAVKPEVRAVIARLHALGIEMVMLTGDHRQAAEAVARAVGVGRVLAEVLPEGKADEIKRLQGEGRRVAMVGDGINDAPALAQADVGIALGTGADVAIEAADLTLLRGDLRGVVTALALALARATMRVIRQNLFWAFAYNVVGIPVAAGALFPVTGWLLSPMLASAAMALSSVSVVTNSLRLRGFRAPMAS